MCVALPGRDQLLLSPRPVPAVRVTGLEGEITNHTAAKQHRQKTGQFVTMMALLSPELRDPRVGDSLPDARVFWCTGPAGFQFPWVLAQAP